MSTLETFDIPGRVAVGPGQGDLPVVRVDTEWSSAEIHLHGAHITHFQKKGEAPLLFLSEAGKFSTGTAIRGGVPIIYPWFGPRDGLPSHGFARTTPWTLETSEEMRDGRVRLAFALPPLAGVRVNFVVTVGSSLMMELSTTNLSETDFRFENCLHTYLHVGAIDQVGITGLQGVRYIDKVLGANFTETAETLRIDSEVDRVYQNIGCPVEIADAKLRRAIHVRKSGSLSTVVWNPWIEKSRNMADFGDDEYQNMVCVESGNIGKNSVTLAPGDRSTTTVEIATVTLD